MYNRYIPGTNGIYERRSVQEPSKPTEKQIAAQETNANIFQQNTDNGKCCMKKQLSSGIDLGDILVLCIILLLLLDSDEDDIFPLLITAIVFLFF